MQFALTVATSICAALGQFSGAAGFWSEAEVYTLAAIACAALTIAWRDK